MKIPNYFYTRMKFGRWKFNIFAFVITVFGFTVALVEALLTEFPAFLTLDIALSNNIMASLSLVVIIIIIEFVSNQNYNLLEDLVENDVFAGDKKKIKQRAKSILWSKYVYVIAGIYYVINYLILSNWIWFDKYEGKLLISHITYLLSGFFGSIIIVELLWIVTVPIILFLFLPKLDIKIDLNIFHSDLAGGLSPIADYLLRISLLITFIGSVELYWVITPSTDLIFSILILGTIVALPIIYFTVPTLGLNKIMAEQKKDVVTELDTQLNEIYSRILSTDFKETNERLNTRIETINQLRNVAMRMREWPFSLAGLRNLLSSFILPIGIFILDNSDKILSIFN